MYQEFELMRANRPIAQAILRDLQTQREILCIVNAEAVHERKERQKRRRAVAKNNAMLAKRLPVAVCGLERLCSVAATSPFQKLLKLRGGNLLFWGGNRRISPGYDMADVTWTWGASIKLTKTGVRIAQYHLTNGRADFERPFVLSFPHTVADPSLRALTLRQIATAKPLDLAEIVHRDDVNELYSMDVLFEILVECANQEKFDCFLKEAIAGYTYTTP